MAKYKLNKKNKNLFFEVANAFAEHYMLEASGAYIKVYLYGLYSCHNELCDISNKQIAKKLSLLESDVINAFKYWEKKGIVKIIEKELENDFDIEFLDITNLKPKENIDLSKPHTYSPLELEIYMEQNENVKNLMKYAEQKLGRLLTSSEMSLIYSLYDFLHLPFDVIYFLLEYYIDKNKKNLRYIEKVAIGWASEGINSLEMAENYVSQKEKTANEKEMFKKISEIFDNNLAESEKKFIHTWVSDFKMSEELIKYAYELTISKTGKPSFPYMNTILKAWFDKKIAEKSELLGEAKPKDIVQAKKTNKFVNFKQQNIDYEELDKKLLNSRLNKKN